PRVQRCKGPLHLWTLAPSIRSEASWSVFVLHFPPMMNDRLAELERLAELGGGEERLRKQHEAGKLTARERVDLLFDTGTFEELDKFVTHRSRDFGMERDDLPGDGVVSGHGRIDGRPAYAFAQDFTVFGGS